MGRCALIRKRRYYLRNALHGLIGAQAISTIALLALLLAVRFSGNRGELRADLEAAAGSCCGFLCLMRLRWWGAWRRA
jgi:hypothetical protein